MFARSPKWRLKTVTRVAAAVTPALLVKVSCTFPSLHGMI
jgi:hypothetical protein